MNIDFYDAVGSGCFRPFWSVMPEAVNSIKPSMSPDHDTCSPQTP